MLEVRCPAGSDLTISTVVGRDRRARRRGLGEGHDEERRRSSIERATAVDARGASGRVEVGACAGDCHVVFVSSNVHIGEAGRAMVATVSGNIDVDAVDDAEVKTVSGNISLGARGGGRLAARSISGSVDDLGARPARAPRRG